MYNQILSFQRCNCDLYSEIVKHIEKFKNSNFADHEIPIVEQNKLFKICLNKNMNKIIYSKSQNSFIFQYSEDHVLHLILLDYMQQSTPNDIVFYQKVSEIPELELHLRTKTEQRHEPNITIEDVCGICRQNAVKYFVPRVEDVSISSCKPICKIGCTNCTATYLDKTAEPTCFYCRKSYNIDNICKIKNEIKK